MDKLPLVELSELVNYMIVSDNYRNALTLSDIDAQISNSTLSEGFSNPVRLNAIVIVLVQEGSLQISLDYISYTVTANYLVTIMPIHVIQVSKPSADFKAKLLMIDREAFGDYKHEKKNSSLSDYMQIRKYPCSQLTPAEMAHLANCFHLLREKIQLRTHAFFHEVMLNATEAFFIEMANIMIGKKDIHFRSPLSRKEEIMQNFLQFLLEHVREEHAVTFYAGKLCITPQYLSLILKELTGKSASQWVDEALLVEAKVLLKTPRTTIQQVADNLNFSDQSTFGKFFKKHVGLSPIEYRKS
ncbi:AraC family transcriptional regulator [Bacteroidia bacterium]|nr:AraC family transcriptional regulator [Bacteroidia bacterium]